MQYMKDSRPASGAEHLYSHCWEMRDIKKDGVQPSHGFKVAVGSLITTALMEDVYFKMKSDEIATLADKMPYLSANERDMQIGEFLGGTPFEKNARKVALEKLPLGDEARRRRRLIVETHPILAEKLRHQLLPFKELRSRLKVLGCPVSLQEIGLPHSDLRFTTYGAGMIRNRYTILDVLLDLGITDLVCERISGLFEE